LESVFGLVLSNLCADDVNEFLKSEVLICLPHCPDNFNNVGISLVETDFLEYFDDFLGIDDATSVLIEDKEDISQLFVVLRADSVSPGGGDILLGFGV
jgi:hypothetical protein